MQLPPDLQMALEVELNPIPPNELATVVASLSSRYRSGKPAGRAFVRTKDESAAYAAFRMPATYAAVHAALTQMRSASPHRNPRSLADFGAGPGTVMWAATSIWPELTQITLYEREAEMIGLGKRLVTRSPNEVLKHASWRKVDMTSIIEAEPHDIIVASYVVGELPKEDRQNLINRLWDITRDTLMIIEPGTPDGFSRIKDIRQTLILKGAHVIAPCPHSEACPLSDSDWCHFSQRVHRSRRHRQVKGGDLSYEDEKFSFISVSRTPGKTTLGRVLRHPKIRKGHIGLELCTPDGLENKTVTRKNRDQFRVARKLRWGSSLGKDDTSNKEEVIS